jgi:succinoglycan biosynthesis protein ExoA
VSSSLILKLPTISVVVAARPDDLAPVSVRAARTLDYPRDLLEILVARGRQPSVQRNAAVRAARGELIYFLDDDSIPRPDSLQRAAKEFADPAVVMVGGPNVCPPEAPPLEQAFALVMGSPLAFGPSSARYRSVGRIRATTEKELILCNLAVRRQAFLDLGGFDEALYPNEENALMDNLRKRGGKLLYHPEMIVSRRPRRSLPAFARMVRNYGRGRAEQFRLHPTAGSALNFVPPLFLVYLALVLWLPRPFLAPLALYAGAITIQTVLLARSDPGAVLRLPAPLILSHLMYGAGFWHGLFTRLGPRHGQPPPEVEIERVPL